MAINYKKTDPNAIGHRVMKERAADLEGKAYAMELEEECLTLMLDIYPEDEGLPSLIEDAKKGVTRFRRAATRAAGAAPLTSDEIKQTHVTFLDDWLEKIEAQHAERNALINEAKRQMELTGEDALLPEEAVEIQVGLDSLHKEIKAIEIRHKFCNEKIAELNKEPELGDDSEETTSGPLELVESP